MPVDGIRENCGSRFLFRPEGENQVRSVMGDRRLPFKPSDGLPASHRGIGLIVSASHPEATCVRTRWVDKRAAELVIGQTTGALVRPRWLSEAEPDETTSERVPKPTPASEPTPFPDPGNGPIVRTMEGENMTTTDDHRGPVVPVAESVWPETDTDTPTAPPFRAFPASGTVSGTPGNGAQNGAGNGSGTVPGTAPGEWPVTLRLVVELRAGGASFQSIADGLEADGVPTKSGKGRWSKGSVSRALDEAARLGVETAPETEPPAPEAEPESLAQHVRGPVASLTAWRAPTTAPEPLSAEAWAAGIDSAPTTTEAASVLPDDITQRVHDRAARWATEGTR